MASKTVSLAVALVMGLTACAAPSQPFLDEARLRCSAGDQNGCREVPGLQAQVNYEHQVESEKVAAGLLVGLAVVGAAAAGAAAASQPPPVYYTPVVVCRWGCW